MSTYVLTEEKSMVQELARDLAQSEIRSRSEEVDHEALFPNEGLEILAESGLLACMVPESYGGAELSGWSQIAVIEETAKECASTAWAVAGGAEVAECLMKYGSEDLRQKVLPTLTAGACAAAVGQTGKEDLVAEKTAEGYILSGVKKNVPYVGGCSWYLISALDGENRRWFLLKGDESGFKIKENPTQLGMKGCALGDIYLENCVVNDKMVIMNDLQETLISAQALNMAAIAAGIAQGSLREAIQYVNERTQFGKTIAEFENTQHVMADLLAKTESARALVWDAAYVKDNGEEYGYAAALAKVMASDIAAVTSRKCLQFMGGYGYSREYPIERKMRDAKMTEIYGGTNELLEASIAQSVVVLTN